MGLTGLISAWELTIKFLIRFRAAMRFDFPETWLP